MAAGTQTQELTVRALEAVLEHSSDAIFSQTLDNVIVLWSPGAERIYGYSRLEMIGESVPRLVPADCSRQTAEIMQRAGAGEQVVGFETFHCTKAGQRLAVSLTVIPLRDARGRVTGSVTMASDLSGQRQAAEALSRLQEESRERALVMETANRVALGILSSRTGVEALRHIAEAARTLSGAQYAALGVARADGLGLAEFVTVGLTPEEEAALGDSPKGKGVLGHLLNRAAPLRIASLAEHPASVGFPANHPPMSSFLGVPIQRGDVIVGSLYLTNKAGGGSFTEADEAAVQTLGAHAAVAIYNLQMLSRQRALVRGLITAQEEERRAVAYDLHDGLTQYVMAAHAHLEAFRYAHTQGQEPRAGRELDQGLHYLKDAVLESRRLVNGLRSLALDDLGLAGALEQHLSEEKARAGWESAEFIHNIAGLRFDTTLETAVYRIAQEALTNARRHASATRVRVMLLLEAHEADSPPLLSLEVRDWGTGFTPVDVSDTPGHVGLHGMAERAGLMDATFRLQTAAGSGTTVRAVFPLPSKPQAYPGEDNP